MQLNMGDLELIEEGNRNYEKMEWHLHEGKLNRLGPFSQEKRQDREYGSELSRMT